MLYDLLRRRACATACSSAHRGRQSRLAAAGQQGIRVMDLGAVRMSLNWLDWLGWFPASAIPATVAAGKHCSSWKQLVPKDDDWGAGMRAREQWGGTKEADAASWTGAAERLGSQPSQRSERALGLGGLGLLVFYNIFSRYKVIKSVPSNGIKCLWHFLEQSLETRLVMNHESFCKHIELPK